MRRSGSSPPAAEDAAEHAPAPKTPAETVAETHWTTHDGGFRRVGCGWNDIGPTGDYAAATRRHVAEETYKAIAQRATTTTACPGGRHQGQAR